jgi:hypothetical protein
VTVDTVQHRGQKESNVIVTFDAPFYREVRIPIKAYIRTDVVLTPGQAEFGSVEQGVGGEQHINVAYAGRTDWTISEVRTNNPNLDAHVVQKARGGGQVHYDLVVSLKPSAPVGNHSQQIVLVTDDANSPFVPVLVHAKVEPDMMVTPAVTAIGVLFPGQTKEFTVVLRGKKPFSIEKIECDSDRNAFAVRLPQASAPFQRLPITVTAPNLPGRLVERFTVTVAGRSEPISFEAYADIRQKPE